MPLSKCSAVGITHYPPLLQASYWQKKTPDGNKVLLSPAQLKMLNAKIRTNGSHTIFDLVQYPESISAASLKALLLKDNDLSQSTYVDGIYADSTYKERIKEEMNLASIKPTTSVRYAVTVRRSNLRNLPCPDCWRARPYSGDDILQETAIDPSEAVLVLHISRSNNYCFVQTRYYKGWLPTDALAFTTRQKWLFYAAPKDFFVVTVPQFYLKRPPQTTLYQMGAIIPIVKYDSKGFAKVLLPRRDQYGYLKEQEAYLKEGTDLHIGYLPCTRDNILAQAFRFLGAVYGWGGLKDSVDCSSFVADVYHCVGIELPRNADEQEISFARHLSFSGLDQKARLQKISMSLKPGDLFYMDGHTMLYVGNIGNTPYIIHALGGYYENGTYQNVQKVVVSSVFLHRYNGNSFLGSFTSANSFLTALLP